MIPVMVRSGGHSRLPHPVNYASFSGETILVFLRLAEGERCLGRSYQVCDGFDRGDRGSAACDNSSALADLR